MNEYPEDEFDRLAKERATQGAHRRPGFKHAWLLALLAVIVLAPLLGIWLGNSYSNRGDQADPTPSGAVTQSSSANATDTSPADDAETSAGGESSQSPTEDASEAGGGDATDGESEIDDTTAGADISQDAQVLLLNGRGVAGVAAENQAILTAAHYTNVSIADYAGGTNPAVTTVYYASAELQATAQDIADKLGGGELVESAAAVAGNDLVVVIR